MAHDEFFRFIRKCKRCNKATSILARYTSRKEKVTFENSFRGGTRSTFECFETEDGRVFEEDNQQPVVPCKCCGKKWWAEQVTGHYNPKIKCNARCTSATGCQCDCSCGGKNHGSDH